MFSDSPLRWGWFYKVLALAVVLGFAWVVFHGLGRPLAPSGQVGPDLRYQQLQAADGSKTGSWLRTLNPDMRDVEGGVVWNNLEQYGVMRFLNLPDPRRGFRYHVWIYDSHRPNGSPVSGAVLVKGSARQELFVAVEPAERVEAPYKFVLTQEAENPSVRPDINDEQILLMAQP